MRFTRRILGGGGIDRGNWGLLPPEKIPSPNFWNKTIKGTPYEYTQVQLARKGLHDPWIRHNFPWYDNVQRRPHILVSFLYFISVNFTAMMSFLMGLLYQI